MQQSSALPDNYATGLPPPCPARGSRACCQPQQVPQAARLPTELSLHHPLRSPAPIADVTGAARGRNARGRSRPPRRTRLSSLAVSSRLAFWMSASAALCWPSCSSALARRISACGTGAAGRRGATGYAHACAAAGAPRGKTPTAAVRARVREAGHCPSRDGQQGVPGRWAASRQQSLGLPPGLARPAGPRSPPAQKAGFLLPALP